MRLQVPIYPERDPEGLRVAFFAPVAASSRVWYCDSESTIHESHWRTASRSDHTLCEHLRSLLEPSSCTGPCFAFLVLQRPRLLLAVISELCPSVPSQVPNGLRATAAGVTRTPSSTVFNACAACISEAAFVGRLPSCKPHDTTWDMQDTQSSPERLSGQPHRGEVTS